MIGKAMLYSRNCGCAEMSHFGNDLLCILDINQKKELIEYKEQYTVLHTHTVAKLMVVVATIMTK